MSGPERKSRVLSTRIPEDTYERLRIFAGLTRVSMNSVVVDAVGAYLAEHGSDKELDALVTEVKEKFKHSTGRSNP